MVCEDVMVFDMVLFVGDVFVGCRCGVWIVGDIYDFCEIYVVIV